MYEILRFPLTDAMETGVEKIDAQHRELLDLAANLVNSLGERLSDATIKENLDFLSKYVATHFSDEEQLQIDVAYPGFAAHKKLHDGFCERLQHLEVQYKSEGNTAVLQEKLNDSIIAWVMDHIHKEDQAFAQYYREETKGNEWK